jgi:mono/diheme cytochrome c family protein
MRRRGFCLTLAVAISFVLLMGCSSSGAPEGPVGPAGPAGVPGPQGPAGDEASASQTFVGSEQCGSCHEAEYDKFILSGHPYKLTKIENGEPPTFPYDDQTGGVTEPPEGYSWDDISYVIGGYGWKARFIDNSGFIVTGDEDSTTQYNFANEEVDVEEGWVAYHAGEEKPYDCGSCHTTGFSPVGHQDGMEGIEGTWAFPGIQCEECHGPGSLHAADPQGIRMTVERSSQLCGQCHIRGNPAQVDASGGFIRHHEQYEELFNSKHFATSCITCHDPHASAVYDDEEINPNKGIRQECDTCHWQQVFQNNRRHLGVDCTDCHLAPLVKSAVGNLETSTGDISSHLFSINPDPAAPQFTDDGAYSSPYITLEYACRQCHNGERASDYDLETLAEMADGYHTPPVPTPEPPATPEPVVAVGDAAEGESFFQETCSICHGTDAKGIPDLGKDLTISTFVRGLSDDDLVLFITSGRLVDDPLNTTGVVMPPRGGNPALTDSDLLDIVAYIRTIEE